MKKSPSFGKGLGFYRLWAHSDAFFLVFIVLVALLPLPTYGETTAPDKLASLLTAHQKDPKNRQKIQAVAQYHYNKKAYNEATVFLWKNIDHLNRRSYILLLKSHEAKQEWPEVIRAANQLIAKKADDEEALTYMGKALFLQKPSRVNDAKEALKKALDANMKHEPAYEVLAQIYQNNRYEERLLYQDMVEIFGPRASFLAKLCAINTADGENEQGQHACQQAIDKNPRNPDNHVYLGVIAKQKGELDIARKRLKEAADKFPKSEMAQLEYATLLESDKNQVDAFKYYARCLTINSQAEPCLLGVGNSGVQIQKYEPALEAYRMACRVYKRKHIAAIRKATATIRQRGDDSWVTKFQDLADGCVFQ